MIFTFPILAQKDFEVSGKMGEVQVLSVCEAQTENGYILKNFFGLLATKGTPIICFENDRISAANETVDSKLMVDSYLTGEEIRLNWAPEIPIDQRRINLAVDSKSISVIFSKIKKKDKAGIALKKVDGQSQSHTDGCDYIIFVLAGEGGDGRESVQRIAARQVDQIKKVVTNPPPIGPSDYLYIPIKSFRQMIDSYSKCKGIMIKVHFYPGINSGIMMTTGVRGGSKTGPIIERYGFLPEDEPEQASPVSGVYIGGIRLDDSLIVRSGGESSIRIICEDEVLGPNDFLLHADKIPIFTKFASMHGEGGVRVYYAKGCDLLFAFRYGSFGESKLIVPKC